MSLAGCGGTEEAAPRPALDPALADRLAARADAVAARLDAGDPCGAANEATALQQAVIGALNARGQVPDALKDDLGVGAADLVDRAQSECAAVAPPPVAPPPTTTAEDNGENQGEHENGRGKKKGRGKHKGKD